MPIYKFQCESCGEEYEDLVTKRGEKSPCPKCGSKKVSKLISAPAPVAKDGSLIGSSSSCPPGCSCSTGKCNL